MAEHELMQSIGRLERAVSRLETLPSPESGPNHSDLAGKHAALKQAAAEAIAQIDALLASKGAPHG